MKIKLIKEKRKDYYSLEINGEIVVKNKERSVFRHIIEVIDNEITTGI